LKTKKKYHIHMNHTQEGISQGHKLAGQMEGAQMDGKWGKDKALEA
jgi:hypothetical protein